MSHLINPALIVFITYLMWRATNKINENNYKLQLSVFVVGGIALIKIFAEINRSVETDRFMAQFEQSCYGNFSPTLKESQRLCEEIYSLIHGTLRKEP